MDRGIEGGKMNYAYWCGRSIGFLRGVSMRHDIPEQIKKDIEAYLAEWKKVDDEETERLFGKKVANET